MIRLRIRPEAAADLEDARSWYDAQRPGLGAELVAELDSILANVAGHPMRYRVVHGEVRRALVRRFPYAVFFVVAGESVVVLAVLHQASDPARWRVRTP